MRTSPVSLFNKCLLAAAVLAATGCASTAPERADDTGFSGPLVDAGRATAGLTARALSRTGYLLGLHDGPDSSDVSPQMDEVDLAMLEEDAVMPIDERPVTVAAVDRIDARPQRGLFDEGGGEPLTDDGAQDPELAVARFVATDQAQGAVVALDDFTHTVGADETLWDIAKTTTGDATNWHALADVNDLGQNASVYPGQDLIIPADMLRPELAMAPVDAGGNAAPAEASLPGPDEQSLAQAPLADPLLEVAPASPITPTPERPSDDARGFVVESGESLWEFARRTTGDATEWQAIAAHNGFDEQRARTIRQGEQIFVPDTLVRDELSVAAASGAQGPLQEDLAPVTERVSPRMVPIAEASAALPAEPGLSATDRTTTAMTQMAPAPTTDAAPVDAPVQTASLPAPEAEAATGQEPTAGLDETQDLTIVEATYREPEAGQDSSSNAGGAGAPTEIMISGTYYPKAIYNEADFSSSLLMRVSPGTRLRVASVDGAWYAVETEDGVGYVHDRDIK